MDDMSRSMPRIYASLGNRQVDFKYDMREVEGNINDHPIRIVIDSEASHSYIYPNLVEMFHLQRSKHRKYWLVHIDTQAKRRINDLVKYCPMDMNGLNTKEDLNII
jgi:hypothetical protein